LGKKGNVDGGWDKSGKELGRAWWHRRSETKMRGKGVVLRGWSTAEEGRFRGENI